MRTYFIAFLLFLGSTTISGATDPPEFDSLFVSALVQRHVAYRLLEDGLYELQTDGGVRTVSTSNIKRNFERDKDTGAVERFLDRILAIQKSLPNWEQARAHLFPLLESSAIDRGKEAIVRVKSNKTLIVLVYYLEGSGEIRFVQSSDLDEWGVAPADAWKIAFDELDKRALKTDVTLLEGADVNLAAISAEEPYKASLLLAPGLKQRIPASLGWPVIAVAPARDFVYLLPKSELNKTPGLGTVVVREFKESGYPISTEVWELSDSGLEAIGEFPAE